ncbi:MAG: tRNA epoxyqueuosine(34) reductase QueG [Prevotella sp.]|nr:tRNA epoxyqueuosine(34) reductase QueG [Prevotella sp.]
MRSRLSHDIKAEAQRLGFFACGIAQATAVEETTAHSFREWLAQGYHAEMHYMENHLDKRLDPRLLMNGLKSIVCVALGYAPQQRIPDTEYQIAAYAYGHDYHDIVKEKLHALATFITTRTDESFQYRVFSDSAPVLERYWAVQAGLGWIGRHHQLIIPHAGSMFFLGELFLDIDLEYDQPIENRCGTCRRCIDACPTGALTASSSLNHTSDLHNDEDHVLTSLQGFDAERCLSYQTIENRGDIPSTLAMKMGQTIYGCDRCLLACPWNRFAKPTQEPMLQPNEELLNMTKEQWNHLTEDDYRRLFKGSAVKRAKYSGLMRNIQAVNDNLETTRHEND